MTGLSCPVPSLSATSINSVTLSSVVVVRRVLSGSFIQMNCNSKGLSNINQRNDGGDTDHQSFPVFIACLLQQVSIHVIPLSPIPVPCRVNCISYPPFALFCREGLPRNWFVLSLLCRLEDGTRGLCRDYFVVFWSCSLLLGVSSCVMSWRIRRTTTECAPKRLRMELQGNDGDLILLVGTRLL